MGEYGRVGVWEGGSAGVWGWRKRGGYPDSRPSKSAVCYVTLNLLVRSHGNKSQLTVSLDLKHYFLITPDGRQRT